MVSKKDRHNLLGLFALMMYTKCFVFAFRAKLQPLKPEGGGRQFLGHKQDIAVIT